MTERYIYRGMREVGGRREVHACTCTLYGEKERGVGRKREEWGEGERCGEKERGMGRKREVLGEGERCG